MAWSIFKDGGGPLVAKGWAEQFLSRLGAPVTPGNVQFVYQWELAEGGGGKYNPLNQGPVAGHPNLTTTGQQFGGGAADFASWDAGLEGAVDFLHYGHYAGVLQGLMSNNPTAARAALWASPWASGHYGYGANWPLNATVPGGQSVLPTSVGTTDSTAIATSANDTCAWTWSSGIPLTGSSCIISKVQLRSVLGVVEIAGGVVVGLIGVIVLMVYGLANSGPGNAVLNAVPGGSLVKKFVR